MALRNPRRSNASSVDTGGSVGGAQRKRTNTLEARYKNTLVHFTVIYRVERREKSSVAVFSASSYNINLVA